MSATMAKVQSLILDLEEVMNKYGGKWDVKVKEARQGVQVVSFHASGGDEIGRLTLHYYLESKDPHICNPNTYPDCEYPNEDFPPRLANGPAPYGSDY